METFQLFKARGIGETISDAFSIFKQEVFKAKFLKVIVPISAVLGIATGYFAKETSSSFLDAIKKMVANGGGSFAEIIRELAATQQAASSASDYLSGMVLLSFLTLFFRLMLSCFSFRYVAEASKGSEIDEDDANTFFFKDLGWYIGYSVLLVIALFAASFLSIFAIGLFAMIHKALSILAGVAFMCVSVYYLVSFLTSFWPICFIEDQTFGAAIRRSGNLMQGHFWETIILGIVIFLVMLGIGIASLVVNSLVVYSLSLISNTLAILVGQVVQLIISSATTIFSTFIVILWYGNLRHEFEGITSHDGYDTLIEKIGEEEG
ncbi:MAG: hypothetical protein ACKVTZ_09425 [Bacteroidia bacterium]